MVRQVRNELGSTRLESPISRPQAQRVEAKAVDTAVIGIEDQGIQGLIQGLSILNPALSRFAQFNADEKHRQEVEQGKQDATLGKDQKSDSELYTHGFLKVKGSNAAAEDMAELQGYLSQNYNPDKDDFDGTVRGWLKTKTGGMTDKAFLEGYAPIMDNAIRQEANRYSQLRQQRLKQDLQASAMQNLSIGMRAFVDQGLPVPEDFITSKKAEFATNFKMSEGEFEGLQFLAAKEHGDKGNYAIYEQFKKNKLDGSPGMYFNPDWKVKIDAAEIHAKTQYLQTTAAADKALKADREKRQESAIAGVFVKALNGEFGNAVGDFKKLVSEQPNLFLASEISEWTNKLSGLSKMSQLEETTEQRLASTHLLARIYQGQAGIKDVIEASTKQSISYSQTQQLLNDVNSYTTSQRQLALQAQANEKTVYKSTQFQSAEDWLKGTLTAPDSMMSGISVGDKQIASQVRANALLELTQASAGKSPSEVQEIANGLAERYSKMLPKSFISMNKEGGNSPLKGSLRYQTPGELKRAHQEGRISDADFDFQYNIFKEIKTGKPQ